MSHELFSDLSAEQQEVVAGGAAVIDFSTVYSSLFHQTENILPVGSASGVGGSILGAGGVQKTIRQSIETGSSFLAAVS
ncbi:MAG: CTB family bacteriocin [Nostoc sp.]|uniref:CTB family bacteriocin n=1 Tax=Nostoc sp. TaxID=1180 RepID=UPI002FEEC9B0